MAEGTAKMTATEPMVALRKALAKAQATARGVEKDGYNQHHRYSFASAEAMITEAKGLLAAEGLAVMPIRHKVENSPITCETTTKDGRVLNLGCAAILRSVYCLVHIDGGSVEIERDWPIVPENGRPMDKATAAADTASLGYFLRDLLQLPRVEEGTDLDHPSRDEHRETQNDVVSGLRKSIGAELDRLGIKDANARGAKVEEVAGKKPQTVDDLKKTLEGLKAIKAAA